MHSRVWTCIMTYVYHYRIIQSYVAALESLCVLPLYPYPSLSPQPLTTNNPIIFLLLPLFCLALSLKKKTSNSETAYLWFYDYRFIQSFISLIFLYLVGGQGPGGPFPRYLVTLQKVMHRWNAMGMELCIVSP